MLNPLLSSSLSSSRWRTWWRRGRGVSLTCLPPSCASASSTRALRKEATPSPDSLIGCWTPCRKGPAPSIPVLPPCPFMEKHKDALGGSALQWRRRRNLISHRLSWVEPDFYFSFSFTQTHTCKQRQTVGFYRFLAGDEEAAALHSFLPPPVQRIPIHKKKYLTLI